MSLFDYCFAHVHHWTVVIMHVYSIYIYHKIIVTLLEKDPNVSNIHSVRRFGFEVTR